MVTQWDYTFYTMGLYFLHNGIILSTQWDYTFYTMGLYFLHNGIILSTQWDYTFYTMGLYFLHNGIILSIGSNLIRRIHFNQIFHWKYAELAKCTIRETSACGDFLRMLLCKLRDHAFSRITLFVNLSIVTNNMVALIVVVNVEPILQ